MAHFIELRAIEGYALLVDLNAVCAVFTYSTYMPESNSYRPAAEISLASGKSLTFIPHVDTELDRLRAALQVVWPFVPEPT